MSKDLIQRVTRPRLIARTLEYRPERIKAEGEDDATSLTLTWDPLSYGDCQMRNASISFVSTGISYFNCETLSTDADDVWVVHYMNVLAQYNFTMYQIGEFNCGTIVHSNEWEPYSTVFLYPPYIYPFIGNVDMNYSC